MLLVHVNTYFLSIHFSFEWKLFSIIIFKTLKVIFVAFLDIQMNRKRAHASNLTSEANNIKFQLPSPLVNANKHVYEMSWVLSSLLYKSSKAGMQYLRIMKSKFRTGGGKRSWWAVPVDYLCLWVDQEPITTGIQAKRIGILASSNIVMLSRSATQCPLKENLPVNGKKNKWIENCW